MRLSPEQIRIIREKVCAAFGPDARVYLFGSRVDDAARGGDVDLYIEVPQVLDNRPAAASRLAAELQLALGDQRFDILVVDPNTVRQRIHGVAVTQGIPL
ncbi:MAG: nucleotidyltransferase domain-containing protein [Nevskia sp.]|jgi:predicted nucleotidyltransferase|nr:nucleotidyltransferase domain-containing protein [Nevskia sp.]